MWEDDEMGWRKRLRRAKKLHRPSLRDWECDGLYKEFDDFVEDLEPRSQFPTSQQQQQPQAIPAVLDARNLTKESFWQDYEAANTPCVIHNIPAGYDDAQRCGTPWPATTKWSLEQLDDSELRERLFKCGEDDDGNSIKVKLKYFLRYLYANRDDSPLYVFDSSSLDNDKISKSLLQDYTVPSYFGTDDLFRLVSESRRPPYRWVLVGPKRSGSCIHIDPLATNAWNTLLFGRKRWVLFPPHVKKYIVKGRGLIRKHEDDEAIHYFMTILPRIKAAAASNRGDNDYRDFCCYEFTQEPGETVFVPHGWWHAVLNLEHSVAVTQNFVSRRNFDASWLLTRRSRKRMAYKLLLQLDVHYPDLAERARQLNQRDGFLMKYDPNDKNNKNTKDEEERRRQNKMQRTV